MTDLLTPDEIRGMVWQPPHIERLCRDYLTLWDRNEELEAVIPKRLIERLKTDKGHRGGRT